MRIRTAGAIAGGAAAAAATSVATYPVLWRRWCLTWGASAGAFAPFRACPAHSPFPALPAHTVTEGAKVPRCGT